MSLDFELAVDPDPKQTYMAIIREVKHGEFELKVVQYMPKDKIIGPARHDIVLPGRYVKGASHNYVYVLLLNFNSMD